MRRRHAPPLIPLCCSIALQGGASRHLRRRSSPPPAALRATTGGGATPRLDHRLELAACGAPSGRSRHEQVPSSSHPGSHGGCTVFSGPGLIHDLLIGCPFVTALDSLPPSHSKQAAVPLACSMCFKNSTHPIPIRTQHRGAPPWHSGRNVGSFHASVFPRAKPRGGS